MMQYSMAQLVERFAWICEFFLSILAWNLEEENWLQFSPSKFQVASMQAIDNAVLVFPNEYITELGEHNANGNENVLFSTIASVKIFFRVYMDVVIALYNLFVQSILNSFLSMLVI